MSKSFRKLIVFRTNLKNNITKQKSKEKRDKYKNESNVCVELPFLTKINILVILISKLISDFFFLETRKSSFSSKCLSTNSIILLKTNEIVSQEKKAQQNYKQLFHKHYHLSETETH